MGTMEAVETMEGWVTSVARKTTSESSERSALSQP